jgi:hypothetical protein
VIQDIRRVCGLFLFCPHPESRIPHPESPHHTENPRRNGFCEVLRFEAQKRLLLGGGGFASTQLEAFFAENATALFGSFFKLLSHSGESL